jgi:hypothetical protein
MRNINFSLLASTLFCCFADTSNSYAADTGYHLIKRLKVGGDGG